ncbi:MAG: hypothetical protein OHK93_006134 [Ramalina farinacea]|uniref:Kinetochore protein Sos7 coiled-coil domain-containing protein n=1 Tax=Ramalina farinacea TaxID=258253 RepID=A0AA43TWH2_9LECA|nr:hypothetical protein [Ramalina farinacea]
MVDQQRVDNVIQGLRALQSSPLSIIRLSEPITAAPTSGRNSDASSSALDNPSAASLEADLAHYKSGAMHTSETHLRQELFSKLRFSYLEQVTKEKFLRAVVGDPPQIVEPAENSELENELVSIKAILKEQKQNVADMVTELEGEGRKLARRWETVQLQTTLLGSLPGEIGGLKETLEELRRRNRSDEDERSDDPNANLPLEATQALLDERRNELEDLNVQLRTLQQALPRQTRAAELEQREVMMLEQEREKAVAIAREAVERKREGGGADELDLRGRWLRSVEGGLRGLLGVQA